MKDTADFVIVVVLGDGNDLLCEDILETTIAFVNNLLSPVGDDVMMLSVSCWLFDVYALVCSSLDPFFLNLGPNKVLRP